VVKYTDTDNNGFLDTIEYDYEGDRKVDLKVSLLDYKTAQNQHPDVAQLIDTHAVGWKGLNELFTRISNQSFQEALVVYRAAWRRGLTTPEVDKLASASVIGDRYDHGYWLKQKVFREVRRTLSDDGTLCLNLGDSYTSGNRNIRVAIRANKDAKGVERMRSQLKESVLTLDLYCKFSAKHFEISGE
jgi:hypothetical protein